MNKRICRVGTIDVPAVSRIILPRRRFIGPHYNPGGRDPDIDEWLWDMEPWAQTQGAKAFLWVFEDMTSLELAQAVLGTLEPDIETLVADLHDGRDLLIAEVEALIETTHNGAVTGLQNATRDRPAYFFLEQEKEFNVSLFGAFPDENKLWNVTLSTCGLKSPKLRSGMLFSVASR